MGKKKRNNAISTLIGTDVRIEGSLAFTGTIRLDGKVKGKIFTDSGTIIVGEKAVIDADVTVDKAVIMGEVNGSVDAREKIEIYPPGRVVGDIQAPTVLIDSGVVFNGSCLTKARSPLAEQTVSPVDKTAVEAPKVS